jgi:uncharacterized protein YndB with AHSA1/START domain
MWTQPEHFSQWYGPKGLQIPVAEMDVRVGGKRLICMEMPMQDKVVKFWTTGEYTEVVPNQRLVYTDSLSDEHGNPIADARRGEHAMPEITVVTVELTDQGGQTRMVMTHAGMVAGSQAANGAEYGWGQSFDKMTDYVAAHIAEGQYSSPISPRQI